LDILYNFCRKQLILRRIQRNSIINLRTYVRKVKGKGKGKGKGKNKGKRKIHPRTGHEDPEGE
jgi:hypothetical protein